MCFFWKELSSNFFKAFIIPSFRIKLLTVSESSLSIVSIFLNTVSRDSGFIIALKMHCISTDFLSLDSLKLSLWKLKVGRSFQAFSADKNPRQRKKISEIENFILLKKLKMSREQMQEKSSLTALQSRDKGVKKDPGRSYLYFFQK